jgi:hypothetical protein
MMFVTREHIMRLAEFDDPDRLIEFTRTKPVRPVSAQVDRYDDPYLTPEQRAWW